MLIYILEDDEDIREVESYALRSKQYEVEDFSNVKAFKQAISNKLPNLILLDIMLPDEDGISILKKLKANTVTRNIPVIMVTAKTTEMDCVKGLEFGADDYICKPFGIMELVSRVKARLRSQANQLQVELQYKGIAMHTDSHTVTCDGEEVLLTNKEYQILKMLLECPGKVFSREQIMIRVWNSDYAYSGRTLDVHMKTLRSKLGEKSSLVKTVRYVGFKLE